MALEALGLNESVVVLVVQLRRMEGGTSPRASAPGAPSDAGSRRRGRGAARALAAGAQGAAGRWRGRVAAGRPAADRAGAAPGAAKPRAAYAGRLGDARVGRLGGSAGAALGAGAGDEPVAGFADCLFGRFGLTRSIVEGASGWHEIFHRWQRIFAVSRRENEGGAARD